jgi:hypothetical protein
VVKTYFDNSDEAKRFQPGTTAEGNAVDEKFDGVASGLAEAEKDTRRSLKFPFETGMSSQEFDATLLQRRNRVLGFDTNGDLALVSGFYYRQDWQPNTDYFLNDVVRDAATTNLYVCVRRHRSGSTPNFTDQSTWYLAIDADTVRIARNGAVEARDLARDWASSLDGPIEGLARSARFYALAAQGDESATRAYRNEVDSSKAQVEQLAQSAGASEANAVQAASAANDSAAAAAQSEASIQGVENNVTDTAQQVAQDASAASASAAEADVVSGRINDTTTMDFLNFELSGPDLIAHFAGYSDAANFTINATGELEVIL